jgi:hypothetical protein
VSMELVRRTLSITSWEDPCLLYSHYRSSSR